MKKLVATYADARPTWAAARVTVTRRAMTRPPPTSDVIQPTRSMSPDRLDAAAAMTLIWPFSALTGWLTVFCGGREPMHMFCTLGCGFG